MLSGELAKPDDRIMILAPVVRGRKGEYRKELEKLRPRTASRAPASTATLQPARRAAAPRSPQESHHRSRRRSPAGQARTSPAASQQSTRDRAEAGQRPGHRRGRRRQRTGSYSEKLACSECGISVPQLEPRSFCFNSPYGACPECNGLGSKYGFDPAKVIVDLVAPALRRRPRPGSGSAYLKRTLELAAYAHGFDLSTPFEKFPKRMQNLILYGYPPRSG